MWLFRCSWVSYKEPSTHTFCISNCCIAQTIVEKCAAISYHMSVIVRRWSSARRMRTHPIVSSVMLSHPLHSSLVMYAPFLAISLALLNISKSCPHYAAWQNATKWDLTTRQLARIMWTLMQHGVAVAWKFDRLCRSHQRFATAIFTVNCSVDLIFVVAYDE